MPDQQMNPEGLKERVEQLKVKYRELIDKIRNTPVLDVDPELFKRLTIGEHTAEMYTEIMRSYSIVLIEKFLVFLDTKPELLNEDAITHIEQNLFNSLSLNLSENVESASEIKGITYSNTVKAFLLSIILPLINYTRVNHESGINMSNEELTKIFDLAKEDLRSMDKEALNEKFRKTLELLDSHGITSSETQINYLNVIVDALNDGTLFIGLVSSGYTPDAYTNIIAECAIVFQRLMIESLKRGL